LIRSKPRPAEVLLFHQLIKAGHWTGTSMKHALLRALSGLATACPAIRARRPGDCCHHGEL